MTDYQQQANDFLNATSTAFTAKFVKHDFYFADDKQPRDIFRCTLKNKLGTYRFNFGQSINNSNGYGSTPPTAYDILASITKYDPGTFDEFCSEFGYFPINSSKDLKAAKKTYKAVLREWKNVEKLFTPEQIEQLQEIQ